MKIVLLGKNGQVGWELQRALAPLGEVVALDRRDAGGDVGDLAALRLRLQQEQAQVIVNATAWTAVDAAEQQAEAARRINAEAVGVMAEVAQASGALLVHYSTDYVFDGSGSAPWVEDAPIAPLSVYGQTKAEGEALIRASGCQHLILRTSWVYAARGGNFAKTMLRLARERDQLRVIADQFGAPTGAELLADVAAQIIPATRARPELAGTYHLAAAGEVSWHGYAQHVLAFAQPLLQARGEALKVQPEAVEAIPTTAYPTPAQRPLNSRLDCSKLQAAFGLRLPPWQHGVQRMLTEALG
ncbi:dTDP-4-dehydrorhamnose reductase [Roseateles sp. BYS180W]|uniref:dTDP-4-dehydrorhamnose reductase n=1 Tax=Roseateles rivi TaxID=3299028 RepID=A0ABW7FZI8_9BURK